ncbi:MAG: protein kinase [Thermoflexales bacterium]|nr:protein kinase [Thermoflexales bacterium]
MTELVAGQNLGKYQIVSMIGRGGMAAVYKAFDPGLKRHVAVKVLSAHLAAEPQILQRFEREAITSANLKHPNIVVIHDVGSAGSIHYIVMEMLEGSTLREEIRTVGALPVARTLQIIYQLSSALDYAHQNDLVHRDLKPGNIMIGAGDHVTLMDFGLVKALRAARLTEVGTGVGTLEYMAPEQLGGEEVDARSDVYSLGIVAYEMLAGHTPFRGDTPFSVIQHVMYSPPPPLAQLNTSAPGSVQHAIERALAKNPAERYASAGQFAQALYGASLGEDISLVDAQGREHWLHKGRTTIGRGPDNTVVLDDNQVSRTHAEISFQNLVWILTDLNSTNGTFVNENRLVANQAVRLNVGDVIRLGPTTHLTVSSSRSAALPSDRTMNVTRPTTIPGL